MNNNSLFLVDKFSKKVYDNCTEYGYRVQYIQEKLTIHSVIKTDSVIVNLYNGNRPEVILHGR